MVAKLEWWCETFTISKYGTYTFLYCLNHDVFGVGRYVYLPVASEKYPDTVFDLETAINKITNWWEYVAPHYKLAGFPYLGIDNGNARE